MTDLFTNTYINNKDIFLDMLKIVVPSLLTYYFTSKNLATPKKREIKQNQFDLVYLPMYLLMIQYDITKKKENIPTFIRRVNAIIYKNYQYVHPKTLKLYDDFKHQTLSKTPNNILISSFLCQIEEDYEKLKIELGYPGRSILSVFKHLNKVDKLLYVSLIIMGGAVVYAVSFVYLSFINGNWFDLILAIPFTGITLLAFYSVWYVKNNK